MATHEKGLALLSNKLNHHFGIVNKKLRELTINRSFVNQMR